MPGGLDREFDRLQRDGEPVAGVPSRLGEAAEIGLTVDGGTPEQFRRYIADELDKWRKVARDIGISAD